MKPTIVTLTGMTCSGKSTLEKMLKARALAALISTTTRKPREGEVDGLHYHFTNKSEFRRLREQGFFIEVINFGGNYYGVSRKEMNLVTADERPAVLVVEPNGLQQILAFAKIHDWRIIPIFVDAPAAVIATRFIERFSNDIPEDLDFTDVVDRYSARLASMLGAESEWREEAYKNSQAYRMITNLDGGVNDVLVIDHICAMVGYIGYSEIKKVA